MSPDSSRVGVRLEGPGLERACRANCSRRGSSAVLCRCPPAGMPIAMLADHPTTGGYPVIAVVAHDDLWRLGSSGPATRSGSSACPHPRTAREETMRMLERAIAAAATAVGADPDDLRPLASRRDAARVEGRGVAVPRVHAVRLDGDHRGGRGRDRARPARLRARPLHARQRLDGLRGDDPRQHGALRERAHPHRRERVGDRARGDGRCAAAEPRGLLPRRRAHRPAARGPRAAARRHRVRRERFAPAARAAARARLARRARGPRRRVLRRADAARARELRDLRRPAARLLALRRRARLREEGRRARERRARRAQRGEARRDRPGLRRDPRRQAPRAVRRRHDPGRRRHVDQHERQRGDRQPRPRAAGPRARASTQFLHPNDHVNCSQSTNDAYPTAIKLGGHLLAEATRSRRWRELRGVAAAQGRGVRARPEDGPHARTRTPCR